MRSTAGSRSAPGLLPGDKGSAWCRATHVQNRSELSDVRLPRTASGSLGPLRPVLGVPRQFQAFSADG
eukprot:14887319-Alexandrium_andersonii.AAC.1